MTFEATSDELTLFDDVTALGASLWAKCKGVEGLSTDPKMFSIMLFKRLWSNHRGYTVLWHHRLQLEGDIILRSGIEASICIAANHEMGAKFIELLHGDAISTLKGQIKVHRKQDNLEMVRECESVLRDLEDRFRGGSKPKHLDWKELADKGGVPHLYTWHKMLSGLSSHVIGASIMSAAANPSTDLNPLQRKMHLMMMAGATLHGSLRHTGMLNDGLGVEETVTLLNRLGDLSWKWPRID